jgi:hypothetical protein
MAYFIFLKYLDSLEDFRKNSHVKIPPKSPCTIFPKFYQILKSIEIRKEFLFEFWPGFGIGPAAARLSLHLGQPTPLSPPIGPLSPSAAGPQPLAGPASPPRPLSPTRRLCPVIFLPGLNGRHRLPAPPIPLLKWPEHSPLITPHHHRRPFPSVA